MNYRIFLNPRPELLASFILNVSRTLHVDPETIPYGRAFEEKQGAYLDPLSRIALGWKHDATQHQLIVRVAWL